MFLAYVITPYSAQGFEGVPTFTAINTRWLVPALIAAAVLAAWVAGRLGRAAAPLTMLLALAAAAGALKGVDPPRTTLLAVGAVLAAAGAVAAAAATGRLAVPVSRRLLVAGAAVALVLAAAGGYRVQKGFNEDRYLGQDPVLDRLLTSADDRSIGIAGEFGGAESLAPWAAYGPDLDNEIAYVGEEVDGRLVPFGTLAEWRSAVADGDYDLLLLSKTPHVVASDADELAFAADTPGLRLVDESDRYRLYEVLPGEGA
jgi:hypothetical protein